MDRITVATLNIRNIADRWAERQGLIYADMSALQPDLLGLQEVVYVLQQDRLIGAAGEGTYTAWRAWAGRPEYGNSLLVRAPLVGDGLERLDLGLGRSAGRLHLTLPDGASLTMAVTHFDHPPDDAAERDDQAMALLAWLDDAPGADATVLVGDFNANPSEPAYARIQTDGFRSSFLEANSREPDITWPSGIQAEGMDTDGDPACLDYIWVRGDVRVVACRLAWDRHAVDDPTLYPTDHLGLLATLDIGH